MAERMAERYEARVVREPVRVPRFPAHVVALVGLSTCGYAIALAGITSLQAAADAATTADRAPAAAGIDQVVDVNDRLAQRLDDLSNRDTISAAAYGNVVDGIARLEADLAALADRVTAVDGASRSLPTSVALPPAVRSVRPPTRSATHATTGGSGVP